MSMTGQLRVTLGGSYTRVADLATVTAAVDESDIFTIVAGSASGQIDRLYADTNTLAASANTDLDLAGGVADPFGQTITFVRVRAIWLRADSTNTNNVVLGNATSNQFVGPFGASAHTVAVPPGGDVVFIAPTTGWLVTAGTGDLLRVANSAGSTSVTYKIVILGSSA